MRVGIIGCGLIGQKRSQALAGGRLVACADRDLDRARTLAARVGGVRATNHPEELLSDPEVDLVVIATPHDALAELTLSAVRAKKPVLVEKPAARNAAELEPVVAEAERLGVPVRVGFNHRQHRAFRRARELCASGVLGELMFLRARYGHGGRLGYEQEWRANPAVSGGGELIDQGVHLIDLSRMFLGDFAEVWGHTATYYWPMAVDDNAFMLLRTRRGQVAWLHASATEWKNTFSLELYGREGKLQIEGLGGSYGTERLTFYRMLPEMGPPETTAWEYPMADDSWAAEFNEFVADLQLGRPPVPGLPDALAALRVVDSIYRGNHAHYP